MNNPQQSDPPPVRADLTHAQQKVSAESRAKGWIPSAVLIGAGVARATRRPLPQKINPDAAKRAALKKKRRQRKSS